MFLKKALFVSFLFLITFSCFAQEENIIQNEQKTIEIDLSKEKGVQKPMRDINQVKAFFCNGENITDSIFLSVIPGQEKDVCIRFENAGSGSVTFSSDFFETSMTVSGYPACSSSDPNNLFTKSISNKWQNFTKVPPQSFVEKTLKLKFPIGYSGLYHFCHYYKIDGGGSSIPMFNIVVHKQNFIDVFVNNDNIELTGNIDVFNFKRETNTFSFSVKNSFSFDQKVDLSASVSNIFGFEKSLEVSGGIIGYNATKDFIVNMSDLPYYKGLFNLKIKINHKPNFEFDTKNSGINPDILDGGETEESINFFIFDKSQLIMLVILALLIFLIKMAFFTKPKVVYIENNNQNLK